MRFSRNLLLLVFVLFSFQKSDGKIIHVPADSSTIQGGINGAVDGDTVLVARGHYYERINFSGKDILVTSYFLFDNDTTIIDSTIIDGDSGGNVVTFESGEGSTSIIQGFTITNGCASGGGGIYCSDSSPKIRNNIITGNSGRGVFCKFYCSAIISDNKITSNQAGGGGGIHCQHSSPTIKNNIIAFNSTEGRGGGILCDIYTFPVISNNSICENSAGIEGGGIYCDIFCAPTIAGNTFRQNSSRKGGGICSVNFAEPIILGNIMVRNSATIGGAIYSHYASNPRIINNTMNANSADTGGGIYSYPTQWPRVINNIISNSLSGGGIWANKSQGTVRFNDLWNNVDGDFVICPPGIGDTTWGTNFKHTSCDSSYNIIRDPLFTDTMNFSLHCNSPCIDAGDSTSEVPDSGGRRIDIGAYEYPSVMGDATQDGDVDIVDVIHIIDCLFRSGPCPCPAGTGDVNCNRYVEIADVVYLINYLFKEGPEPGCY